MSCSIVGGSRVTALIYVKQPCLPALLLLLGPQPVGFVLVGIITCRRRDQPRALTAEVVEATAYTAPANSAVETSVKILTGRNHDGTAPKRIGNGPGVPRRLRCVRQNIHRNL